MTPTVPIHGGRTPRRGMLLLLVLSMLTLFVLMGSLAIVIATRSRASARAFADANGSMQPSVVAKAMAEEALLTLIRGSKDSAVNSLLGDDSLLKDMYGTDDRGPFIDEPYDAFDASNKFLTQVTLDADGRVSSVPRPAFGEVDASCTVDNDGDGVLDGIWIPQSSDSAGIFQPLTLADGNTLTFRVSYLVLDLDARINVNAHGKRDDAPTAQPGEVGPADVNASSMLTPDVWKLLMAQTSGTLLLRPADPSEQWRPLPPISSPVDGRFGGLKDNNDIAESDTYQLRLDLEALRPATLASAAGQNPFTLGELERVLRQFDADASTLPPRLAGILDDRAERARMLITTDSWETPAGRTNIAWDAANSGRTSEQEFFNELCQKIAARLYPKWNDQNDPDYAKLQKAEQWVANIIEFRDIDNGNPPLNRLTGGSVTGVEPHDLSPAIIPGGALGWDQGIFRSYAQVLGVPQGTQAEIKALLEQNPPAAQSLAIEEPRLLELLLVPTLFTDTYWEVYSPPPLSSNSPPNKERVPIREPGRINVNTCDKKVWDLLVGETCDNPFDGEPSNAATDVGQVLVQKDLVFNGQDTLSVTSVNHAVANRLANVATVRSHVFAVWVTLEVKRSDNPDQPTYHRLFAIVDRSIPVEFNAAAEGQNKNFRDIIRLQRFLN